LITELHLDQTPIKELPFSFQNLTRLQSLCLSNCGVVKLPSCITAMSELDSLSITGRGGMAIPKTGGGWRESEPNAVFPSRISSSQSQTAFSQRNLWQYVSSGFLMWKRKVAWRIFDSPIQKIVMLIGSMLFKNTTQSLLSSSYSDVDLSTIWDSAMQL
jgi:Leucine-rich repeat (LRR) protein